MGTRANDVRALDVRGAFGSVSWDVCGIFHIPCSIRCVLRSRLAYLAHEVSGADICKMRTRHSESYRETRVRLFPSCVLTVCQELVLLQSVSQARALIGSQ